MNALKTASPGTKAALLYITIGALLMVWTAVWYAYLRNSEDTGRGSYYVCAGLFISGLILTGIGLAVGRIGQSAREADQTTAAIVPTTAGAPPAAIVSTTPGPNPTTTTNRTDAARPTMPHTA